MQVETHCGVCNQTYTIERKRINLAAKRGHTLCCGDVCRKISLAKKRRKYIRIESLCRNCGQKFSTSNSPDAAKCCSTACITAFSWKNSPARRTKQASIQREICLSKWQGEWANKKSVVVEKICRICGLKYSMNSSKPRAVCSESCRKTAWSIGGRKSVLSQSSSRRSKNEKLFAQLCEKNGMKVVENEPIFNGWDADIIFPNEKIAVLWNGKWHYEKITQKHSVAQVQNRDRIKIHEIKKAGFTPYVIKDMGSFDSEFVAKEFDKFKIYIGSLV